MFFNLAYLAISLWTQPVSPIQEPVPEQSRIEIYYVRDLIMEVPNFNEAPELDLNAVINHSGTFKNKNNQLKHSNRQPDELMELIDEMVDHEAWSDTANMRYRNGHLIIKAPESTHQKLR